jgi:SAM-dependent methyltransferase
MEKVKPFQLSSEYYDLIYKNKNYLNESNYILNHLRKLGFKGKKILEFGCGTGKHAIHFLEKGLEMTGIDASKEMISISSRIPEFKCFEGDVRSKNLEKKFDSILSLFHVISYQITNDCVSNVFKNANKHLIDNGLFFFDIWYAPAVLTIKPEERIKEFKSKNLLIKRYAKPELVSSKNLVIVNYEVEVIDNKNHKISFSEVHKMRYFSLPEIEYFANINGFELVHSSEWMKDNEPNENTWSVSITLKK